MLLVATTDVVVVFVADAGFTMIVSIMVRANKSVRNFFMIKPSF